MAITRVSSSAAVRDLAHGLLDPRRLEPWVVVTSAVGSEHPFFDIDDLEQQVGDVCPVYLVQTGPLTQELAELLPDRCQVFGGAARAYPVDLAWMDAPELAPLRFLRVGQNTGTATDRLAGDALAMATAAGLFARPPAAAVRVSGTVKSLIAGDTRAFVLLDSGGYATLLHELLFPTIPLPWVVREGMAVEGLLDRETGRLTLDTTDPDSAELLRQFPHGSVTLALVIAVERQSARIAVHPSVPITVPRSEVSSNTLDRVDLLLAAGDVVRVRVLRDEQGRVRLRLSDVDDDEATLPSMPLLRGGSPWLEEDRQLLPAPDDAGEPASDKRGPADPGSAAADAESAVSGPAPGGHAPGGLAPGGVASGARAPGGHASGGHAPRELAPVGLAITQLARADLSAAARAPAAPGRPTGMGFPMPGPGRRKVLAPIEVADSWLADADAEARPAEHPLSVPAPAPVHAAHVAPVPPARMSALLSTQLALEAEKALVRQLRAELAELASRSASPEDQSTLLLELVEVHTENVRLKRALAVVRGDQQAQRAMMLRHARQLERAMPGPAARRTRFDRDDEWLRLEIHLAWLDRLDPADRLRWPLPEPFGLGARFADSVLSLDAGLLPKVLRAVVDVLTGRVRDLPARRIHPLRSGDGATAADLVRAHDGARCFRVYVEQNTPQARRLHYWAIPDGTIELSRVVLHDDMEP